MIRVGVIGTSSWTEQMYIRGLAAHPDGEVVAVCGQDYTKTRQFAAQHTIPDYYTDYRDLMDSGDVDAVIVSTPNHTHFPMVMHALKNGLHVFCEKPLALSYAQADAMATEADRRGLVNMVGFTYTYFPHIRYMAHLVQDGYIGTLHHMSARFFSMVGLDGAGGWRFDRRYGGEGALMDIGVHLIAVALAVLGKPEAVSASLHTHVKRDEVPAAHRASDHAVLSLYYAAGAVCTIEVSSVAAHPKRGGVRQGIELSGDVGVLYYQNDFSAAVALRGAQAGDESAALIDIPAEYWDDRVRRGTPREIFEDLFTQCDTMSREFVRAIAAGDAPDGPTFRDGAHVQKIVDTAIASHYADAVRITCQIE